MRLFSKGLRKKIKVTTGISHLKFSVKLFFLFFFLLIQNFSPIMGQNKRTAPTLNKNIKHAKPDLKKKSPIPILINKKPVAKVSTAVPVRHKPVIGKAVSTTPKSPGTPVVIPGEKSNLTKEKVMLKSKEKNLKKKLKDIPSGHQRLKKIIAQNNRKVSQEDMDNEDILKLYLPILQEEGVMINDREKAEDMERQRVIQENPQEDTGAEDNNTQLLPTINFSEKTINSGATSSNNLKMPVRSNIQLKRKNKNIGYSTNLNGSYQCILEDGRKIKRAFSIFKEVELQDFLLDNGVSTHQVSNLSMFLKEEHGISKLMESQYVVVILKRNGTPFKQHKVSKDVDYTLQRLVVFYKDGCLLIKIKKGFLIQKKMLHNNKETNFFAMDFTKLDDFQNLSTIQNNCPSDEYDFLSYAIKFLIGIFSKSKTPIKKIQIIFQEKKSNQTLGKVHKKPRAIFVYTEDQKYCCYLYKDFACNFHLLNANGNNINLELLDVQKNPPIDGRVSSLFGYRKHPVLKKVKHHQGLDISAPLNTCIFATLSGWVMFAGTNDTYGNFIIICYGNVICTLYGHLQNSYVTTGDYVEAGRLIGAVGSTGRSSGNHLHYEIFKCKMNLYTIAPCQLGLFFGARTLLDPGLRYKISLALKPPEMPYFLQMVENINGSLNF